jgi:hypothetical protein
MSSLTEKHVIEIVISHCVRDTKLATLSTRVRQSIARNTLAANTDIAAAPNSQKYPSLLKQEREEYIMGYALVKCFTQ